MAKLRGNSKVRHKQVLLAGITILFNILAGVAIQCEGLSGSGSTSDVGRTQVIRSMGPLRVHTSNPRYFTDGSGKTIGSDRTIYLTGSHTWPNFKDIGTAESPSPFNFVAYLGFMQGHNHNFMRMWTWELTKYAYDGTFRYTDPFPWPRTGPGQALDGKPKFDLSQFNEEYFERLRSRVIGARDRGIYVSIMLFEGHGIQFSDPPWRWDGHPFNVHNNVNGIDGDPNRDGKGLEVHTLEIPAVTTLQEAYIRKVIDTVNDLDNVLYEIANETGPYSTDWQYHMINYIKEYEKNEKRYQHPVGMTFQYDGGDNNILFDSPADWISPRQSDSEPYKSDPPAADGSKVIILDTDHLWGIGGNHKWVWKSFLRGLNPIYMDPYGDPYHPTADKLMRRNLGHTRRYANTVNLAAMAPRGDLASTDYCLANPVGDGAEYLVYLPDGGTVRVDLSGSPGELSTAWFNPRTGSTVYEGTITGGVERPFTAPFSGDAVLHLWDGPIFQFYLPSIV